MLFCLKAKQKFYLIDKLLDNKNLVSVS
jgi:hypothetical protein